MGPTHLIRVAVLLFWGIGCGGPQQAAELQSGPLGQARALDVLELAAAERDLDPVERHVEATLATGISVLVDVGLPSIEAGFLYLNEQDRRDYGDIPDQAEGSELHAIVAFADGDQDRTLHLLVVQDNDFVHVQNPRADQRRPEDATRTVVEARLRRDALDFIQAVIDLRGGDQPRPSGRMKSSL